MISKQCRMLCVAAAMLSASGVSAAAQFGARASRTGRRRPPRRQIRKLRSASVSSSNLLSWIAAAPTIRPRPIRSAALKKPPPSSKANSIAMVAQARRQSCENTGFFDLFRGGPNAQCAPLNSQISQMRGNLDRINGDLQRLQRAGVDYERDGQRRALLTALSRNECGPQYRQAQPVAAGTQPVRQHCSARIPVSNPTRPATRYRTVCVRTCDGFFFPISFSTSPSRFADDQRTCQRMCPAAEAVLYTHRNPGEDMNQAVSAGGRLYTRIAERLQIPPGIQRRLLLQETGRDLGRGAERSRRPLDHRARRHSRDGRARQGDERAARCKGPPDPSAESAQAGSEGDRRRGPRACSRDRKNRRAMHRSRRSARSVRSSARCARSA